MSVPPDPPASALILHGWQNHRPPGHWQHLLTEDLRSDGIDVRYPQLPDPDQPDWRRWRALIADELARLTGQHRVVLAHSLATWALLDVMAEPTLVSGCRILLVAPVARETLASNPPIAAFDRGRDDADLRSVISQGGTEIVCSDDDPYWPGGAADWARELGATVHPLTGQGHLALDDGYGRWPSVRDWVHHGGRIKERA
jgi:serine hydrolase